MREVIRWKKSALICKGIQMRKLIVLIAFAGLTACGGSNSGLAGPQTGTAACSNDGQKQFVLDQLYAWYLWNDLLPNGINIADYASPEELVARVTTELGPKNANGDPIDLFSSVGSAVADSQFFGEGKFEGFGFSWRFIDQAQTDFRITRTFSGSPAAVGGLARGQQILSLNGRTVAEITANEGVSAFFAANDTIDFEVQPIAGASFFTSPLTKAVVTIDPVPQWRIIDAGNGVNVGYLELTQFISTADPEFATVFSAFQAAGVNDVIIDLRYNGGGLVSTAELLGDYLGGSVAPGLVFSSTEFNADRAAQNNYTTLFSLLGNSVSLSKLVVIASRGTASASELVTNGMIPHVDVAIVGDRTFGKPVGQIGLEFCDKILRPTSFKMANALGDGDYFGGLPVDCPAADDLSTAVGDDLDPNMIAAMSYINTGACPVTSLPGSNFKGSDEAHSPSPEQDRPLHPELLDTY
jgi:C-terminal processing protease CtpA/Prc